MGAKFPINRMNELGLFEIAVTMPVPQQEVVVEDVQRNTGKAPALFGEELLAGQHLRVLVGEGIYRKMVANAFQNRCGQG